MSVRTCVQARVWRALIEMTPRGQACTRTCLRTGLHKCLHTCLHTCLRTGLHKCLYTHVYAHVYAHAYNDTPAYTLCDKKKMSTDVPTHSLIHTSQDPQTGVRGAPYVSSSWDWHYQKLLNPGSVVGPGCNRTIGGLGFTNIRALFLMRIGFIYIF